MLSTPDQIANACWRDLCWGVAASSEPPENALKAFLHPEHTKREDRDAGGDIF